MGNKIIGRHRTKSGGQTLNDTEAQYAERQSFPPSSNSPSRSAAAAAHSSSTSSSSTRELLSLSRLHRDIKVPTSSTSNRLNRLADASQPIFMQGIDEVDEAQAHRRFDDDFISDAEMTEWQLETTLDLSGYRLDRLPAQFFSRLKQLKSLVIRGGRNLGQIPAEEIGRFINLESLEVQSQQWTSLPPSFRKLQSLTRLDMNHISFTDLESLALPCSLRYLRLFKCGLSKIPLQWAELTELEHFEAILQNMRAFPRWMCEISGLQKLNLVSNKLQSLPEEISQFQSLIELDVSNNQLEYLPQSLSKCGRLQRLDIQHNHIGDLPIDIGDLELLQTFTLSDNKIFALPSSTSRLPAIQRRLDLSVNELCSLPDWIWTLSQLEVLNLSSNQCSVLPSGICRLNNLIELNLSSNQLIVLPDDLRNLAQLQILDAHHNQLTSLPDCLSFLDHLRFLDVTDNILTDIPHAIGCMPNLEELRASGNPLRGEMRLFAQRGSESLLAYFKELGDRESLPQRSCHLIAVGRGEAGKSTIIRAIHTAAAANRKFQPRTNSLGASSIGADASISATDGRALRELCDEDIEASDRVPELERTSQPTFSRLDLTPASQQLVHNGLSMAHSKIIQVPEHPSCRLDFRPLALGYVSPDEQSCGRCGTITSRRTNRYHCHCYERFVLCEKCSFRQEDGDAARQSVDLVWSFTDLPGQSEFFSTYTHFVSIPNALVLVVSSIRLAFQCDPETNLYSLNFTPLEEDIRLWCSMINQLAESGKRVASASSFLVLTHLDWLKKADFAWAQGVEVIKQEFDDWMELLQQHLPHAYPACFPGKCVIRCVNARNIPDVTEHLWDGLLVRAAEELLHGQTTPQFFAQLKKDFHAFQQSRVFAGTTYPTPVKGKPELGNLQSTSSAATLSGVGIDALSSMPSPLKAASAIPNATSTHDSTDFLSVSSFSSIAVSSISLPSIMMPPYLPHESVTQVFMRSPFLLRTFSEAERAIEILLTLGEIIRLPTVPPLIVLSPAWLSHVMSSIVKPAQAPFFGPKMNNGVIRMARLRDFLLDPARHDGCQLFQESPQVDEVLNILASLDLIVRPDDVASKLKELKQVVLKDREEESTITGHFTLKEMHPRADVFIPSRVSMPFLSSLTLSESSWIIGRRVMYADHKPHARLPPGTIAMLTCWLGGFSQSPQSDKYSQWQTLLVLGKDERCLLHLDEYHRYLDVVFWGSRSILSKVGPKLLRSVRWALAFTCYHGTDAAFQQVCPKPSLYRQGQDATTNSEATPLRHTSLDSSLVGGSTVGSSELAQWEETVLQEQQLCLHCIRHQLISAAEHPSHSNIGVILPNSSFPSPSPPSTRAHTDDVKKCQEVVFCAPSSFCTSVHTDDFEPHQVLCSLLEFPPPRRSSFDRLLEADKVPLEVRKWSFRDVYEWFIKDEPLHVHFFRNSTHVRNWDGNKILELADISSTEELQAKLEKYGYSSFPPLRDQMIDGIYRLNHHWKAFLRNLQGAPQTTLSESSAPHSLFNIEFTGSSLSHSIVAQTVNQTIYQSSCAHVK